MIDNEEMKRLTHILCQYKGAMAKLWLYVQSLKQLHIQLMRPNEELSADLICYDCTRLQAKTSWEDIDINIIEIERNRYEVIDVYNELLIECGFIRFISSTTEPIV